MGPEVGAPQSRRAPYLDPAPQPFYPNSVPLQSTPKQLSLPQQGGHLSDYSLSVGYSGYHRLIPMVSTFMPWHISAFVGFCGISNGMQQLCMLHISFQWQIHELGAHVSLAWPAKGTGSNDLFYDHVLSGGAAVIYEYICKTAIADTDFVFIIYHMVLCWSRLPPFAILPL